MRLGSLCSFWRWKLGAKDLIPETTRDAKAVLVVCVVMLEVVLLELFVVGWKTATAIRIRYRVEWMLGTHVL